MRYVISHLVLGACSQDSGSVASVGDDGGAEVATLTDIPVPVWRDLAIPGEVLVDRDTAGPVEVSSLGTVVPTPPPG